MLHKAAVRILPVKCTLEHFELIKKGMAKDMFPIALKPDILKKLGFIENENYYLQPEAKEFILTLPVKGEHKNEVLAYLSAKKESYARAAVNDLVISHNIYNLHQLQNLYYALIGEEMMIEL